MKQPTRDYCLYVYVEDNIIFVPLRQSQRVSKPPLRMTYDVMGQPSFQPSSTAGVRGVTVTYPQQLLQPVTVPWIQQPVVQPYSYVEDNIFFQRGRNVGNWN